MIKNVLSRVGFVPSGEVTALRSEVESLSNMVDMLQDELESRDGAASRLKVMSGLALMLAEVDVSSLEVLRIGDYVFEDGSGREFVVEYDSVSESGSHLFLVTLPSGYELGYAEVVPGGRLYDSVWLLV